MIRKVHIVFWFLMFIWSIIWFHLLVKFTSALILYLSLLEQQEKFDAAVEVLSGDLGSLIGIQEDRLRIQVLFGFRLRHFGKVLESFPGVKWSGICLKCFTWTSDFWKLLFQYKWGSAFPKQFYILSKFNIKN